MSVGVAQLGARLRRFRRDQSGQIAIIFAVSAMTLVSAVGAGVDLSRAFVARQQLYHAATLTCQYSARPSVVSVAYSNGQGTATYIAQVDQQAAKYVSSQSSTLTQTNASPFTYAIGGNSSVNMQSSVPTIFMGLAGVKTMPVSTTVACANGSPQANDTQPSIVVSESFENSACDGSCWSTFAPNGAGGLHAAGISSTPTNTPSSNYGYTGASGVQWSIMGYCLEVDHAGVTKSTAADGNYSAELDCDNGSGTAGNSSISTRAYLSAGNYELRYNYSGRIFYPDYSPVYVCGATDNRTAGSDLGWPNTGSGGWANDTSSAGGKSRTNQVNVYLDPDTSSNVTPPTHTTIDGTQTLAGADLIDECVYSDDWIQRSVKITVNTAGYYWLSFAADGGNDSYGGQVDNIRLCHNTCPVTGTLDNFPSAWASKKVLFEDTFDSPARTNPGSGIDVSDTLYQSYGTSGSSSGWPSQAASGWALSGVNQINYLLKSSYQGAQSLELDTNGSNSNRSMTRPFFLDPGYYQIDYNYVSDALIQNSAYAGNGPFCLPPNYPQTALANQAKTYGGTFPATHRITGASLTVPVDTNWMAVMMTHSQLTSHPNMSSTFNAATTYTNPDGTTQTSSPTVAWDSFNWSTYSGNSGRNNPVLDQCAFNATWTARTTYIQITKPGQYWLTFAGAGTADGVGGAVDDVKLTALNSLYGAAPSFYVTIPTAGPAPGSSYSPAANAGYTITADPLTP